jgi:hypothetical protein
VSRGRSARRSERGAHGGSRPSAALDLEGMAAARRRDGAAAFSQGGDDGGAAVREEGGADGEGGATVAGRRTFAFFVCLVVEIGRNREEIGSRDGGENAELTSMKW